MAISFISQATGTTTVTLGAHAAGDLILLFAYRDGNTTPPTIPTGQNWTTVYSATGANVNSHCVVRKIAASSSETVGTFSLATGVVAMVFRGVDQTTPIGAHLQGGAQSTTVAYNGITLQVQNASSWIAAFAGHRSVDTNLQTAPGALTNRATRVDATCEVAGHSTADGGGVSTWVTTNVNVAGSSSGWRSHVLEIRAEPQNETGGSTPIVNTTASGSGSGSEILSGASTATVTVTATGSGTAAEAVSDSSTTTVTAAASGAGTAADTGSGGSTTTVTVAASGAGEGAEAGTDPLLYVVVYPAALAAPSAAQVIAGQNSSGSAATWAANATPPVGSGTYDWPSVATGLTPSTNYRHAVVWSNGVDTSSVAVSDSWQTAAVAQHESGSSTTTVSAVSSGSGTAAEAVSEGATATITVAATGSGSAEENASSGSTATVTAGAQGSGTAAEAGSGSSTATITAGTQGAGAATEAPSQGSTAVVWTYTLGRGEWGQADGSGPYWDAGYADQAYATGEGAESGGSTASVLVTPSGSALALEIATGGSTATVSAATQGAGSAATSGGGGGTGATAAEIWGHVLSNGLTAEATLVAIHAALHNGVGLTPASIADAVWNKELL